MYWHSYKHTHTYTRHSSSYACHSYEWRKPVSGEYWRTHWSESGQKQNWRSLIEVVEHITFRVFSIFPALKRYNDTFLAVKLLSIIHTAGQVHCSGIHVQCPLPTEHSEIEFQPPGNKYNRARNVSFQSGKSENTRRVLLYYINQACPILFLSTLTLTRLTNFYRTGLI